jgi:iron complex outermembrane receptor protein
VIPGGCANGVPNTPAPGAPRTVRPDLSGRWDYWTWHTGLEFQATDEMLLYGKAGTGYRSGGFNGRASNLEALAIPFDEEYVTTYELGAKRDWLENRLRTNFALFYSKYKDRQVTELVPTTSGVSSVIVNSGSADVSGGELEAWYQALDPLRLSGSVGWNWFRDDTGNRGVNSPALTYTLAADYLFPPFRCGELNAHVDFQYQSPNRGVAEGNPYYEVVKTPAFGILNTRIAMDLAGLNSEVALYVHNVFDREYYLAGVDFGAAGFGYATRYWAPGRKLGVELTYRFGSEGD